MNKRFILLIITIFSVLFTGCQKGTFEDLVTTSGEAETTAHIVEVETTTEETETTSACNEEEYITTFNPYGKEIEVLDWHGNSLKSIRPKEIIADNKKYVYEYEYHNFRSSKKVFDGDSLVEEVLYEYGRDGMDMPILKKKYIKIMKFLIPGRRIWMQIVG